MRFKATLALATVVLASSLYLPSPQAQTPADDQGAVAAFEQWREARDQVAASARALAGSEQEVARLDALAAAIAAELELARAEREEKRRSYAVHVVQGYMHGSVPQEINDVPLLAMTSQMQYESYKDSKREVENLEKAATQTAEQRLQELAEQQQIQQELQDHEQLLRERDTRFREAVREKTFNPTSFEAYQRAANVANETREGCGIPAALLAGVASVSSAHGEARLGRVALNGDATVKFRQPLSPTDTDQGTVDGDSQRDFLVGPLALHPFVWGLQPVDGNGDGQQSVDNVYDAASAAGRFFCQGNFDFKTAAGLRAALYEYQKDAVWGERVWATSYRYSKLDPTMGEVPRPPFQSTAALNVPPEERFADGDVDAMMLWAASKVGVPYSQCIGRPQDPECPPGTNRYGVGFFDCSGFVAAAYARIGVGVPLTTYAMEADSKFMTTQISDRIEFTKVEPGDILLMDGHVALWFGDGKIIHATGGGVTIESVPAYMMRDVFAVLRPV